MQKNSQSGFTLIEVMMATIILGLGFVALLNSLTSCIRMVDASKSRQKIQYVFTLGELKYPIQEIKTTVEEDLTVTDDHDLERGFVFSRTVDEKEDPETNVVDDRLYVVRTVITWNDGNSREEVLRYVRQPE